MSLLLDALNRASKDKAAAAAATQNPLPVPVDVPVTLPVLELSLAPDAHASAPQAPVRPDAWHTEQAVAAPDKPLMAPFVQTQASQAATPVASPPTPVAVASRGGPSAPDAPRVAQDIVRAKAPAPRAKPPLRWVILGSLAVLLAGARGSVLMGWWGDPSHWLQSGGLAGSSMNAPTVAARVEPAGASPAAVDPVTAPASAAVPAEPTQPPARRTTAPTPADPPTGQTPDTPVSATPTPGRSSAPAKASQALVQSRTAGPSALELAYAALVQGRLPAAAQAYEQALLAHPEERDALLGLAYIAHQQGQTNEARDYYQRVLRHDPGNPVARSGLLAINAIDDPQASASRAREVAEQNPDSAAAQSTLGHAMVREGRLADAQQAFFRAHSLEPGVALHAFNLAVALDRLRQYGPARQYYERTLALSTQTGGERASGVPQAVVQTRLEQLRAAHVANPLGAARE